jgi:PKD repeat protein
MPTANFTANTTIIEEMDEVQFNFTGFEGTVPASYQWDFGDGSPISVEKDPIHQYTTAGNYTVSLNVTDNNGDSDVETKVDYITVNINLMPIASFTVNNTSLLENEWVEFTFTGDIGDPPASYLWDFGDGSPTSDAQNPTHQYTTAGTYDVTLVVTDASGDNDTEIKSNYIVVGEFQMSCVINSPQMNTEYAYMAPAYSITVSGVDILTMWYTLNDNNASKYYFTVFSGIIDQSAWDAIPEGHVAIRFYIQDVSRGTINELVIVIKDLVGDVPPIVPPTPGIPGYDLTIIIGSLAIICIVLIRKFSEHYK